MMKQQGLKIDDLIAKLENPITLEEKVVFSHNAEMRRKKSVQSNIPFCRVLMARSNQK